MDADLAERLRAGEYSLKLAYEAADALEAAETCEAGLREALELILRCVVNSAEAPNVLDTIGWSAREALTAHPPLERSEAPSTMHSTLCALNATGHRGPCTCGAGSE